jgi:mannose-6-phosphate isomerase-like protein (cupin superfamily)
MPNADAFRITSPRYRRRASYDQDMNENPPGPFDLKSTFIHLGLGARATPLPDFRWTPEYLAGYEQRFASDGDEGRIVVMNLQDATWDQWERHPAGEEVVVLLSGRVDLIQEIDGSERRVELRPGLAVVNPPGVWHTAEVHEPGDALFITPGRGTEHRPR